MSVYKYKVPMEDDFAIELPIDAVVLSVQVQRGSPYIWAKGSLNMQKKPRHFRLVATGTDQYCESLHYIGTFQLFEGDYVGHLFELPRRD